MEPFSTDTVPVTSPFYFAPNVLNESQQPINGFYALLLALQENCRLLNMGSIITKANSGEVS